jgi:hypothetical protein
MDPPISYRGSALPAGNRTLCHRASTCTSKQWRCHLTAIGTTCDDMSLGLGGGPCGWQPSIGTPCGSVPPGAAPATAAVALLPCRYWYNLWYCTTRGSTSYSKQWHGPSQLLIRPVIVCNQGQHHAHAFWASTSCSKQWHCRLTRIGILNRTSPARKEGTYPL